MTKCKTSRWNAIHLTTCVALLFLFAFATEESALAAIGSKQQSGQKTPSTPAPGANQLGTTPRVRILVQPKNTIAEDQLQNVFASLDAKQEEIIKQINVRILSVPETAHDRILDALSHHRDIEFAEEDALVPPSLTPNDPSFNNQWHLAKMKCPNAWDITCGSTSVIIAICDSGVDATHPDLAAAIVPGWNFYDNNSDSSDTDGHGTGVAGTAAAIGNNGVGVSGVAMNCRIMPIRISDATGYAYYSAMANAVTYAADHGARVANLSFKASNSSAVRSAAQYLNSKGGVLTVSAGNDGLFDTTADNPYLLTVSATDSTDTLASWSSTGNNVDLAAPGVSVLLTMKGGGYGWGSGTSFSAPCVAGAAALLISIKPSLSATEVMDLLKQTADDLGAPGWDTSYGYGRVNAYKAVLAATGGTPPPPTDSTPPTATVSSPADSSTVLGTVTINVTATDDVGVRKVECYINGVLVGSSSSATPSFSWNTTTYPNGPGSLSAIAYDAAGNTGSSTHVSINIQNPLPDLAAPIAQITALANGSTLSGTVPINISSSDNVGVVKVECYLDGTLLANASSASLNLSWATIAASNGSHTLLARAYDAANNIGTASVTVLVSNTAPPDTTAPTVQITSPANGSKLAKAAKISVTSADNVGIARVDLYIDGKFFQSSTASAPIFNWSTSKVASGPHTLQTFAYDAAGNKGASAIITVNK